jgi:hypothetical protein
VAYRACQLLYELATPEEEAEPEAEAAERLDGCEVLQSCGVVEVAEAARSCWPAAPPPTAAPSNDSQSSRGGGGGGGWVHRPDLWTCTEGDFKRGPLKGYAPPPPIGWCSAATLPPRPPAGAEGPSYVERGWKYIQVPPPSPPDSQSPAAERRRRRGRGGGGGGVQLETNDGFIRGASVAEFQALCHQNRAAGFTFSWDDLRLRTGHGRLLAVRNAATPRFQNGREVSREYSWATGVQLQARELPAYTEEEVDDFSAREVDSSGSVGAGVFAPASRNCFYDEYNSDAHAVDGGRSCGLWFVSGFEPREPVAGELRYAVQRAGALQPDPPRRRAPTPVVFTWAGRLMGRLATAGSAGVAEVALLLGCGRNGEDGELVRAALGRLEELLALDVAAGHEAHPPPAEAAAAAAAGSSAEPQRQRGAVQAAAEALIRGQQQQQQQQQLGLRAEAARPSQRAAAAAAAASSGTATGRRPPAASGGGGLWRDVGTSVTLRVLRLQQHSAPLCLRAMQLLAKLTATSRHHRRTLGEAGAVRLLMSTMRTHPKALTLQRVGMVILGNMAASVQHEKQARAVAELAVAAMKGGRALQAKAEASLARERESEALRRGAADPRGGSSRDHPAAAGGVDTPSTRKLQRGVAKAASRNAAVQLSGCWLLYALSYGRAGLRAVRQAGAEAAAREARRCFDDEDGGGEHGGGGHPRSLAEQLLVDGRTEHAKAVAEWSLYLLRQLELPTVPTKQPKQRSVRRPDWCVSVRSERLQPTTPRGACWRL